MREADSIVLVMDGQLGLTAADEEIVSWLRRTHPSKPLLLAVNKCENPHKADLQASTPPSSSSRPRRSQAFSLQHAPSILEPLAGAALAC